MRYRVWIDLDDETWVCIPNIYLLTRGSGFNTEQTGDGYGDGWTNASGDGIVEFCGDGKGSGWGNGRIMYGMDDGDGEGWGMGD